MAIKIMLVDDHQMIRDGLRALIEKQPNRTIVAEAANGQDAVRLARKTTPDIVIMDIGIPQLNGIEATRQIATLACKPKVIGLSMHSDKRYVAQMLKAGAAGYLVKGNAFEELDRAISMVLKGHIYLSPEIAGSVSDHYRQAAKDDEGTVFALLTERERQVLQQIAEGSSTKEIAAALGVSIKTIETHRLQIMAKLKLHSVAELTKYAVKEGLTDL